MKKVHSIAWVVLFIGGGLILLLLALLVAPEAIDLSDATSQN